MVMNTTFNCRLTVSRSPIAHKVAGFNSPALRGVCQLNGPTNGHRALKADLEGLERQYLTLVEFVLSFPPVIVGSLTAISQHQPVLH